MITSLFQSGHFKSVQEKRLLSNQFGVEGFNVPQQQPQVPEQMQQRMQLAYMLSLQRTQALLQQQYFRLIYQRFGPAYVQNVWQQYRMQRPPSYGYGFPMRVPGFRPQQPRQNGSVATLNFSGQPPAGPNAQSQNISSNGPLSAPGGHMAPPLLTSQEQQGMSAEQVALPQGLQFLVYGTTAEAWVKSRIEFVRALQDPNGWRGGLAFVMLEQIEKNIRTFVGQSGQGLQFIEQTMTSTEQLQRPGQKFAFVRGTEKWFLTEAPVRTNSNMLVIRKESDPLTQVSFPMNAVFTAGTVRFSEVTRLMGIAEERRKSEQADAAGMRDFDLPRNRPVAYLGFYPTSDPTERSQIESFGPFLRSRGYPMVGDGQPAVGIARDPIGTMRTRIAAQRQLGVKDMFLNISVHGDEQGIVFGPLADGTSGRVSPQQFLALLNQFPDCNFFITLNACHGGGFNTASYTGLNSTNSASGRRVTVFVQTKPELLNPVHRPTGSDREQFSSPYDYFLVHYLQQGMSYGQAHLAADEATKRLYPGLDAGVFRSGASGGVSTADAGQLGPLPLHGGPGGLA